MEKQGMPSFVGPSLWERAAKMRKEKENQKQLKSQLKSIEKMEKRAQEQQKHLDLLLTNIKKTEEAQLENKMKQLEENSEDFKYPQTPSGDKKILPSLMPNRYSHINVEKSWYEWWEKAGYFLSDSSSPIILPPNVTGALHIRHALTAAIQDTIVRWKRMSGYNTLWVPGFERPEEGNLGPTDVANEGQNKDFPEDIFGCGADALRFSLVSYATQTNKVNLEKDCVVKYQQWCNKVWNAVRFALSKLGDDYTPPTKIVPEKIVPEKMPSTCQWILSVLNKAISKTISSLESYEFSDASSSVYFWWNYQFCDIFIEVIKPYFNGEDMAAKNYAQDTLWVCLDYGLRLLHPFMPYLTEELWQRLPSPKHYIRKESLMICEYPSVEECWTNEKLEYEMKMIESAVKPLESCRLDLPEIEPDKRHAGFVISRTDEIGELFRRYETEISTLAKLSSLEILTGNDAAPAGCEVSIVNEAVSVGVNCKVSPRYKSACKVGRVTRGRV